METIKIPNKHNVQCYNLIGAIYIIIQVLCLTYHSHRCFHNLNRMIKCISFQSNAFLINTQIYNQIDRCVTNYGINNYKHGIEIVLTCIYLI